MEQLNDIWQKLIDGGLSLGKHILLAIVIYFVGRWVIKFINNLVAKALEKRKVDPAVKSFVSSMVNITLLVLLILSVVGALGVEMTSFAALLASAGVAIGMALSGNLQNFAGGLVILILRPFKIGDYIEFGGISGTVRSIQIFNTILATPDNKVIFVPNNAIATGTLTNYSREATRRVDFTFAVEYGSDFKKVKGVLERLIAADERILKDPAYMIVLGALADSSVNVSMRVWVNSPDYWDVYFSMTEKVYNTFKEEGIEFPFPQLTVHNVKE